jgi:hypothetical protein
LRPRRKGFTEIQTGNREEYLTQAVGTDEESAAKDIFIYSTLIIPRWFEVVLKIGLEYVFIINYQIEVGLQLRRAVSMQAVM